MLNENWVKDESVKDYRIQALRQVKKREQWEVEQIKLGKRKTQLPHPSINNTLIIKFI